LLPAVLLLCAALAAPAGAAVRVGIGDQDVAMFDQPAFKSLKVKRIRYIVPYDWYKDAGQTAQVDAFMKRARRARADVLVHFTARRGCYQTGNRYSKARVCRAPRMYARAIPRRSAMVGSRIVANTSARNDMALAESVRRVVRTVVLG